jgi:hypothetical protein
LERPMIRSAQAHSLHAETTRCQLAKSGDSSRLSRRAEAAAPPGHACATTVVQILTSALGLPRLHSPMQKATRRQINTRESASGVTLVLPHPRDRSDGAQKHPSSMITVHVKTGESQKPRNQTKTLPCLGAHGYIDNKSLERCCTCCPRVLARAEILCRSVKTWEDVSDLAGEISKGTRSAWLNCGTCQGFGAKTVCEV